MLCLLFHLTELRLCKTSSLLAQIFPLSHTPGCIQCSAKSKSLQQRVCAICCTMNSHQDNCCIGFLCGAMLKLILAQKPLHFWTENVGYRIMELRVHSKYLSSEGFSVKFTVSPWICTICYRESCFPLNCTGAICMWNWLISEKIFSFTNREAAV